MTDRTDYPGGNAFEYYKAVCRTSELTRTQKLIAVIIRNHWSPKETHNPSNKTIAAQAQCSVRHVQRELRALERKGWLEGRRRVGRTTVWRPTIPSNYLVAGTETSPAAAAPGHPPLQQDRPDSTSAPDPTTTPPVPGLAHEAVASHDDGDRPTPHDRKVTTDREVTTDGKVTGAGAVPERGDFRVMPKVTLVTPRSDTDVTPGEDMGVTHTDPFHKERNQQSKDYIKRHTDSPESPRWTTVGRARRSTSEQEKKAPSGKNDAETPFSRLLPETMWDHWPFREEGQFLSSADHLGMELDFDPEDRRASWERFLRNLQWPPEFPDSRSMRAALARVLRVAERLEDSRRSRVVVEALFRCMSFYALRGRAPDLALAMSERDLRLPQSGAPLYHRPW